MSIVGKVFKKSKLGGLLILAVLLSGNVFAWFIYSTRVDSSITAHIRAWDIEFVAGNTQLSQEVTFEVNEIYPGMVTHTDSITATNNGEGSAMLDFELVSASILGTTYIVTSDLTSDQLLTRLQTQYPFTINLFTSVDILNANGGSGTFSLSVSWPYESGDDATDTYWGNAAYEFSDLNPSASSITIVALVTAIQSE